MKNCNNTVAKSNLNETLETKYSCNSRAMHWEWRAAVSFPVHISSEEAISGLLLEASSASTQYLGDFPQESLQKPYCVIAWKFLSLQLYSLALFCKAFLAMFPGYCFSKAAAVWYYLIWISSRSFQLGTKSSFLITVCILRPRAAPSARSVNANNNGIKIWRILS